MSQRKITAKTLIDPIDKIVNERAVQTQTVATTTPTTDDDDIHRVAFNMPKYIYNQIHPKLKKHHITMTNYILGLIRKDIGE